MRTPRSQFQPIAALVRICKTCLSKAFTSPSGGIFTTSPLLPPPKHYIIAAFYSFQKETTSDFDS